MPEENKPIKDGYVFEENRVHIAIYETPVEGGRFRRIALMFIAIKDTV